MKYILNSAVITTPGRYDYRLIGVHEAQDWLNDGQFLSTIGYPETCDALASLTGHLVPCNRSMIQMQAGDEALVFRLTVRLQDPAIKGLIGDPGWIADHCEIGILKKEG